MQYVRSISGSVSKTWNSINPATLSGAIDVVVVEQQDGTLACSPFHVRFGKFSLLRPSEKKVEFKVNGVKQDYSMKLGDGGEAFFVFETSADIPEGLQTSPVISPTASPASLSQDKLSYESNLQEPEPLDLGGDGPRRRARPRSAFIESSGIPILNGQAHSQDDLGELRNKAGCVS
jgi:phosphatidate phosphatase LPIN